MRKYTDEELINRIGTGDNDAGQMQYERYQDPVHAERIITANR